MRIFEQQIPALEDVFSVVDANLHYLKNVVRAEQGKNIDIMTSSELISAVVKEKNKKNIILSILSRRALLPPDYNLKVYQCILKREYMDNVIEKYTELGVTEIVPVISGRSIGVVKDNTFSRYLEIAKSAALQSEQEFIVKISGAVKFEDITPSTGDNFLFYERGENRKIPSLTSRNISIIIGPEGGLTSEEVNIALNAGFQSITPLNSVLKAETAAVVFAGLVRVML